MTYKFQDLFVPVGSLFIVDKIFGTEFLCDFELFIGGRSGNYGRSGGNSDLKGKTMLHVSV